LEDDKLIPTDESPHQRIAESVSPIYHPETGCAVVFCTRQPSFLAQNHADNYCCDCYGGLISQMYILLIVASIIPLSRRLMDTSNINIVVCDYHQICIRCGCIRPSKNLMTFSRQTIGKIFRQFPSVRTFSISPENYPGESSPLLSSRVPCIYRAFFSIRVPL